MMRKRMKMTKQATDQFHWDFERLFDRTKLVVESWEGAALIDQDRLHIAKEAFGEALALLRGAIQDA